MIGGGANRCVHMRAVVGRQRNRFNRPAFTVR